MDKVTRYRFVEEVRQQCRFALLAFQHLRTCVNSVDTEKAFLEVDAFLQHALGVARLLWPSRETSLARGEMLRTELAVAEDSALALRGIRAQLEAVDERFEDWLEGLPQKNYVDMNIMPTTALGEFQQDSFQRSLDPDTYILALRGQTCDLRRLQDALVHLEKTVDYWRSTHHPW